MNSISPRGLVGLGFEQAHRHALKGGKIRWSLWDTWLTANERGEFHFMLSGKLSRELGTDYAPTDHDVNASDWQVQ